MAVLGREGLDPLDLINPPSTPWPQGIPPSTMGYSSAKTSPAVRTGIAVPRKSAAFRVTR
jgi:hypothetical protein